MIFLYCSNWLFCTQFIDVYITRTKKKKINLEICLVFYSGSWSKVNYVRIFTSEIVKLDSDIMYLDNGGRWMSYRNLSCQLSSSMWENSRIVLFASLSDFSIAYRCKKHDRVIMNYLLGVIENKRLEIWK